MSTSDRISKGGRKPPAKAPATRAGGPMSAREPSPARPGRLGTQDASWASGPWELLDKALDNWPRTLRLVVLLIVPVLSAASIVLLIQLDPVKWVSVLAAALSVISAVAARRRGSGGNDGPSPDGDDPP